MAPARVTIPADDMDLETLRGQCFGSEPEAVRLKAGPGAPTIYLDRKSPLR